MSKRVPPALRAFHERWLAYLDDGLDLKLEFLDLLSRIRALDRNLSEEIQAATDEATRAGDITSQGEAIRAWENAANLFGPPFEIDCGAEELHLVGDVDFKEELVPEHKKRSRKSKRARESS